MNNSKTLRYFHFP